jgi:hypothetical protein
MIDADIACDNSQNSWEWGISSYVISTTYGNSYQNGPTILYSDEQMEYNAFISWYDYSGCAHTDVDIDPTTHYGYAVYDWYDNTIPIWKLLVRVIDFANIETGFDTLYEINGSGNLKNPVVAAYDNTVVILAQTDEKGNDDIICFYSDDKFVTVHTSFVVDKTENEMYPDVRFDNDGNFICTYLKNNHLYALKSDDGGATWIEPGGHVNINDNVFIEEYKASDLSDFAIKEMVEVEGTEEIEIWIGDVVPFWNLPPHSPAYGKINIYNNYTVKIVDPERDDIFYYIDWGDGNESGWLGPYSFGQIINTTYKWLTPGKYEIRIKAKDILGAESNWSVPFTIYITSEVFFFGLIPKVVNKSEGATILNITIGLILKFNPTALKMYSSMQILILRNDSCGLIRLLFVVGRFYVLILSE